MRKIAASLLILISFGALAGTTTLQNLNVTGKTGIGNTSPSTFGATNATNLVVGDSTVAASTGITLLTVSGASPGNSRVFFSRSNGGNTGGAIIYDHAGAENFSFLVNNTEKMRLNSLGLGIGQTPSDAFDVTGNAAITGNLRSGGVITGDGSGVSNISAASVASGTLNFARLPNPTATTIGGIKSLASVSHNFLNQIGTDGSVSQAQPVCADLSNAAASCATDATNASNIASGTLGSARLPLPGIGTPGGVASFAAVTHQFLTTLSTAGNLSAAQPAFSDITGSATGAQLPTFTGDVTNSGAAMTVASIQTTTVTGTTGTGKVAFATSPQFTQNIGVGAAAASTAGIQTGGSLGGNTSQVGVNSAFTFTGQTSSFNFQSVPTITASTNVQDFRHYYVADATKLSSAAIQTQYGLKVDDLAAGVTNYSIFTGAGQVSIGDTTQTVSSVTGAEIIAGGLGVKKDVRIGGVFTGDGSGISNISAASVASGTLSDSRLPSSMATKTFTGTTNFPGSSSIDGSGNATFGGTLAVTGVTTLSSNPVITTAGNTGVSVQSTVAGVPAESIEFKDTNASNSQANWIIGANYLTNGAIEFIPSTLPHGTTYSTAAFKIASTGAVTIPGTLAVTGNTTVGDILQSGGSVTSVAYRNVDSQSPTANVSNTGAPTATKLQVSLPGGSGSYKATVYCSTIGHYADVYLGDGGGNGVVIATQGNAGFFTTTDNNPSTVNLTFVYATGVLSIQNNTANANLKFKIDVTRFDH